MRFNYKSAINFLGISCLFLLIFIFSNSQKISAQGSAKAGSITLNWADNSLTETGFYIERQTGTQGFMPVATVGANTEQYIDLNVDPLTIYSYRIYAYNSQGSSLYSGIAQTTTTAAICGNSWYQKGEGCDDGNIINGDGCSSVCAVESGWSCTGSPSICTHSSSGSTTTSTSSAGGSGAGGAGVSLGGGSGGVLGNSVSIITDNTPEITPNNSEENPSVPQTNGSENVQNSNAGISGKFIDGLSLKKADWVNITIFIVVLAIAFVIYLEIKKVHKADKGVQNESVYFTSKDINNTYPDVQQEDKSL